MPSIIGRKAELHELDRCFDSNRPELVVVYGRRRVGKTFLIKEYFENTHTKYQKPTPSCWSGRSLYS